MWHKIKCEKFNMTKEEILQKMKGYNDDMWQKKYVKIMIFYDKLSVGQVCYATFGNFPLYDPF